MADIQQVLSAVSALVVIAGGLFVVLQLRVNTRLQRQSQRTLEATLAANKARTSFDLIGKVIDPSFAARRYRLYEVAAKHSSGNWEGFDRSLDDFEVRNFANIYEQLGLLVKKQIIEVQDVMDAVSAQPMADWRAFKPIRDHIMEESARAFQSLSTGQTGIEDIYWPNFKWLAEECAKWVQGKAQVRAGSQTNSVPDV